MALNRLKSLFVTACFKENFGRTWAYKAIVSRAEECSEPGETGAVDAACNLIGESRVSSTYPSLLSFGVETGLRRRSPQPRAHGRLEQDAER
jgi:hypothetical protein